MRLYKRVTGGLTNDMFSSKIARTSSISLTIFSRESYTMYIVEMNESLVRGFRPHPKEVQSKSNFIEVMFISYFDFFKNNRIARPLDASTRN
jgi:hypothetical protein